MPFRIQSIDQVALRALRFISLLALALTLYSPALHAQEGSFGGTILIDASEKPLAGAEVVLRDLNRSVRSDSAGNFVLKDLPLGKHVIIVRMIGYESVQTDITLTIAKSLVEADLFLKPTTTKLAIVDVKAASSPYASRLMDFEERRSTKTGRYITSDVFEKEAGRPLSAIVTQKIPGVKAVPVNGKRWLASLRGMTGLTPGPKCNPRDGCVQMEEIPKACYMQVAVNGIIRYNGSPGQPMFDIDEIDSQDVIGFEFYTVATTPLQYKATSGAEMGACGTVIIWTKGG